MVEVRRWAAAGAARWVVTSAFSAAAIAASQLQSVLEAVMARALGAAVERAAECGSVELGVCVELRVCAADSNWSGSTSALWRWRTLRWAASNEWLMAVLMAEVAAEVARGVGLAAAVAAGLAAVAVVVEQGRSGKSSVACGVCC